MSKQSCRIRCKDTNFSANHNTFVGSPLDLSVVVYVAKIRIFQLITTFTLCAICTLGCRIRCKDTNFSANHNYGMTTYSTYGVVVYVAKIRIFQLITTEPNDGYLYRVVVYVAKIRIFQLITTRKRSISF